MNGSVAELCSSSSLLSFHVMHNAFDGEIPRELGNSPTLERLRLRNNKFTGSIPVPLGIIRELSLLDLSGDLLSLNIFNFNGNQLFRPIPSTIGKLGSLYELQLSRNGFNGDIPRELGQLKNLQSILDLSWNNITGDIPSSMGTLSKLEALDLSHNQLVGEVPPEIGDMSSLGRLNLSYNNLQGKLRKQLSHWPAESFEGNLNRGSPLDGYDNRASGKQSVLSQKSVVVISAISTLTAIALLVLVVSSS